MAYTLKPNKTITDEHGIEHVSAYAAVDEIINNKRSKSATIILKVHASKEKANEGKTPLETISFICKNWVEQTEEVEVEHNDYNDYLSVQAIDADDNEFNRAYAYINDKQLSGGSFKFEEWESDNN